MISPNLKIWADAQLSAGVKHLVVDLEVCTGMDSTFMGTIAGMAMRLVKSQGLLEIASASDKNRQSLEDLGLSSLMKINPPAPIWMDKVAEIRASLEVQGLTRPNDRTQHVFDAHKTLCEADDSNNAKFSSVLDCLEAELQSRGDSQ